MALAIGFILLACYNPVMEKDKNPFPKIELFPRLSRLTHFLFDHLQSEGLSDHNSGGGPMLDRELYDNPDQLQLDFESQSDKGW